MEDCIYYPCDLCNTLFGFITDCCGFCGKYKPKEDSCKEVDLDECCRDNDCIDCNKSEEIKKPPLGLKPRWIHEQQRRHEIISAMERFSNADVPIPMEWIEELKELS